MTTATLREYKTSPGSDSAALERYIDGMKALGWRVSSIYDGEEATKTEGMSTGKIVSECMAVEQIWLRLRHPEVEGRRIIYCIFQCSPMDLLVDCSCDEGKFDADMEAVEKAAKLGSHFIEKR